ncbi:S-adenosyl-L-methionine-binding protein [Achromatium sp. WMS3]|nr:S-adenosyl-L-methionine-binding protein [Achromatium sp. WMS3]
MPNILEIGTIKSPFNDLKNMPIQPIAAKDIIAKCIIDEQYIDGLKDLEGFSHIYLIYKFHKASRTELTVVPFMDTEMRGVFATRSPLRPSHIGISIVELLSKHGNILTIRGCDILDGTPIIDIKPYIAKFDLQENTTSGWMKATIDEISNKRSDERFIED